MKNNPFNKRNTPEEKKIAAFSINFKKVSSVLDTQDIATLFKHWVKQGRVKNYDTREVIAVIGNEKQDDGVIFTQGSYDRLPELLAQSMESNNEIASVIFKAVAIYTKNMTEA